MMDKSLLDNPRRPRYPIVLCHGLYGFDMRGPFWGLEYHYWSAALDALQKRIGAKVVVCAVPPTGSIEQRAKSLHEQLCDPATGVRGQRINFVGHSMGGLDVRYLIANIRPSPEEYIPMSLTSLSTPHRGSPFMDWCNANIGIGLELMDELLGKVPDSAGAANGSRPPFSLKAPLLARKKRDPAASDGTPSQEASAMSISAITKVFGNVSSAFSSYLLSMLDQPAYAMLSTQYMTRVFNPRVQDSPDVRYFSIAGRAQMPVWHPLWLPKLILDSAADAHSADGEADGSSAALGGDMRGNDGLVSVSSARWGQFLGVMEGWDHWDMRGPGGPRSIRVSTRKEAPTPGSAAAGSSNPSGLARGWLTLNQMLASWRFGQREPERGSGGKEMPARSSVQGVPDTGTDTPSTWLQAVHSGLDSDWHPEAPAPDEHLLSAAASSFPSAHHATDTIIPLEPDKEHADESEIARRLAEWIASQLPRREPAQDQKRGQSQLMQLYLEQPQEKMDDQTERDKDAARNEPAIQNLLRQFGWGKSSEKKDGTKKASTAPSSTLLTGILPSFGARTPEEPQMSQEHLFHRFWGAICRNLHDQGL